MFVHGVPFIHLVNHGSVLSSAGKKRRKTPTQKADADRLVNRLGFEPIHLLRSSKDYPLPLCIQQCLRYGDTILAFPGVPYPRVQLSRQEWGVPFLEISRVAWVLTTRPMAAEWLHRRLPGIPLMLWIPREWRRFPRFQREKTSLHESQ